MSEMTCQELVEAVTDYLDDALEPAERDRFEAHLPECPFCTEYIDQMREVAGSLRPLGGASIAPAKRDALLDAFRGRRDP